MVTRARIPGGRTRHVQGNIPQLLHQQPSINLLNTSVCVFTSYEPPALCVREFSSAEILRLDRFAPVSPLKLQVEVRATGLAAFFQTMSSVAPTLSLCSNSSSEGGGGATQDLIL